MQIQLTVLSYTYLRNNVPPFILFNIYEREDRDREIHAMTFVWRSENNFVETYFLIAP